MSWTPNQRSAAVAAYEGGASLRRIASDTKRSLGSVMYALKNVPKRERGGPNNRPFVAGDRIEILDEAMTKHGYRFGIVTEPKSSHGCVSFTIEGDDSGDVCLLPREKVKRA